MFLHQATSFSYDAFVNGLSLLLLAYLFSAIYEKGTLPVHDRVVILVVTALLAPAKGAYFTLVLLAVLIPGERYRSRRDKVLSTFAYILIGLLMMIPFNWTKLQGMLSGGGTAGNPVHYTTAMALRFPVETAKVFLRTFELYGLDYLLEAIGQSFSGLTLDAPPIYTLVLLLLLIGAAMPARETMAWIPTGGQRATYVGLSVFIGLLIYMGQFFSWTPIGYPEVYGIQGRYFIPVLPLLFVSMRSRGFTRGAAQAMLLLSCGAVMVAWVMLYIVRSTIGWV